MISRRFVWSIVGLLLFALVPTALNLVRTPDALRAGALAEAIPATAAGFRGPQNGGRTAEWAQRQFGVTDFVSRTYESSAGTAVELFAARSYDAKKLFHFPELALSYGSSETARGTDTIETSSGPLPAHTIEFTSPQGRRQAMYVLLYGTRGVERPIAFMFARVPELFIGKREPMTLIYVQAAGESKERLLSELKQLLAGACERR